LLLLRLVLLPGLLLLLVLVLFLQWLILLVSRLLLLILFLHNRGGISLFRSFYVLFPGPGGTPLRRGSGLSNPYRTLDGNASGNQDGGS
jgi:hypothetical protein